MKNSNGFTLMELLAVITVLGIVIALAVAAVIPQLTKSRKNTFALDVMELAKAAETKYRAEEATYKLEGDISTGICTNITDLDDYIEKDLTNYSGIIILKSDTNNPDKIIKEVHIANNRYYYNTSKLSKITYTDVKDGNSSKLTKSTCN